MAHQSSLRVVFAMASLGFVAACHVATEPPITDGTAFVLDNINGARLPAGSGSSASGEIVIADTLVFLASEGKGSGRFERLETVSGPDTAEYRYGGSYDWRDGLLSMSWGTCPLYHFCSVYGVSATGRFGPGTLTITYHTGGSYHRTYRRVN
jgi:hypothetical protein